MGIMRCGDGQMRTSEHSADKHLHLSNHMVKPAVLAHVARTPSIDNYMNNIEATSLVISRRKLSP